MRTELFLPALLATLASAAAHPADLSARAAALDALVARDPQWQFLARPLMNVAKNGIKNGIKVCATNETCSDDGG